MSHQLNVKRVTALTIQFQVELSFLASYDPAVDFSAHGDLPPAFQFVSHFFNRHLAGIDPVSRLEWTVTFKQRWKKSQKDLTILYLTAQTSTLS